MERFIVTYFLSNRLNVSKKNIQVRIIEVEEYQEIINELENLDTEITIKYIRNMESNYYSYYDHYISKLQKINNQILKNKELWDGEQTLI